MNLLSNRFSELNKSVLDLFRACDVVRVCEADLREIGRQERRSWEVEQRDVFQRLVTTSPRSSRQTGSAACHLPHNSLLNNNAKDLNDLEFNRPSGSSSSISC